MKRRGFLGALFAPAVIRTPGLLMPVRPPLVTVAASSIYAELSAITRKAVIPLLYESMRRDNALVNLWLAA